mmetsp:Transcript_29399/g.49387  ORF Transcript_29399/g.49387 Transcript_29399/m.49387 type:complete len:393 (-) Transcript_29399:437-1615(-)
MSEACTSSSWRCTCCSKVPYWAASALSSFTLASSLTTLANAPAKSAPLAALASSAHSAAALASASSANSAASRRVTIAACSFTNTSCSISILSLALSVVSSWHKRACEVVVCSSEAASWSSFIIVARRRASTSNCRLSTRSPFSVRSAATLSRSCRRPSSSALRPPMVPCCTSSSPRTYSSALSTPCLWAFCMRRWPMVASCSWMCSLRPLFTSASRWVLLKDASNSTASDLAVSSAESMAISSSRTSATLVPASLRNAAMVASRSSSCSCTAPSSASKLSNFLPFEGVASFSSCAALVSASWTSSCICWSLFSRSLRSCLAVSSAWRRAEQSSAATRRLATSFSRSPSSRHVATSAAFSACTSTLRTARWCSCLVRSVRARSSFASSTALE